MSSKLIAATEFKATCLRIINDMSRDGQPVTITRRGHPVAVLSPVPADDQRPSIIGAMKGSVLRYDEPFAPAVEPDEWDAMR